MFLNVFSFDVTERFIKIFLVHQGSTLESLASVFCREDTLRLARLLRQHQTAVRDSPECSSIHTSTEHLYVQINYRIFKILLAAAKATLSLFRPSKQSSTISFDRFPTRREERQHSSFLYLCTEDPRYTSIAQQEIVVSLFHPWIPVQHWLPCKCNYRHWQQPLLQRF